MTATRAGEGQQNNRLWSSASRSTPARGSVLVCVLVVLLVTGMMAIQGTKLLLATSRARGDHARLEQSQELLALGRMRLQQQLRRDADYDGETLTVEIRDEAPSQSERGEIRIEKVIRENEDADGWRIVATAPLDQPGQVTARWETE